MMRSVNETGVLISD